MIHPDRPPCLNSLRRRWIFRRLVSALVPRPASNNLCLIYRVILDGVIPRQTARESCSLCSTSCGYSSDEICRWSCTISAARFPITKTDVILKKAWWRKGWCLFFWHYLVLNVCVGMCFVHAGEVEPALSWWALVFLQVAQTLYCPWGKSRKLCYLSIWRCWNVCQESVSSPEWINLWAHDHKAEWYVAVHTHSLTVWGSFGGPPCIDLTREEWRVYAEKDFKSSHTRSSQCNLVQSLISPQYFIIGYDREKRKSPTFNRTRTLEVGWQHWTKQNVTLGEHTVQNSQSGR